MQLRPVDRRYSTRGRKARERGSCMKAFASRELNEAKAHAIEGGQALHIHRTGLGGYEQFASYWEIGRLFDQNVARLVTTARALGVHLIEVQKKGTELQHIQLCGRPLKRAKQLCYIKTTKRFVDEGGNRCVVAVKT